MAVLEGAAECNFLKIKNSLLSSLGKGKGVAFGGLRKKPNFIPFSLFPFPFEFSEQLKTQPPVPGMKITL